MRPRSAALAVLLIGLALLAPAAAAAPVPVRAATADPTQIEAVTPSALAAGIPATLVATLRDTATGAPVGGEVMTFSVQTKFGWLQLGNATTNAQGEGGVQYEPVAGGSYDVVVAFAGDASYAPSNTTLALTVLASSAAAPPLLPPDRAIVLVIVAVVGGVWSTYAFVVLLILGIRSAGSRPDEEFESQEMESMAKEADESTTPRVPASATANRAAIGLAIAALLLAGTAVALVAAGGIGRTAAYVPSTVQLQVTVIPDFRGAGWDSFIPDELVVHAGDTVKVTVYNEDTMDHGFAVDAFGVNQVLPAATQDNTTGDITPSVTVVTFVVPTAGAFLWYCTNPCGPGHMTMTGTLVVLPDD